MLDLLPTATVTKSDQLTAEGVASVVRIKFAYLDGHIGFVHITADTALDLAAQLLLTAGQIRPDLINDPVDRCPQCAGFNTVVVERVSGAFHVACRDCDENLLWVDDTKELVAE